MQRLGEDEKLKFAFITADIAGNKRLALHLAKIDCENDEADIGNLISEISRMGHDAERDLLELKEFTKNLIEAKTKAEAELTKVKETVQEEESVIEKIQKNSKTFSSQTFYGYILYFDLNFFVSIMGSLVGLFFGSTDPDEVNKKLVGRSFNVKTGTMQSTKKVYDVKDQNKATRPDTPKIVSEELKSTSTSPVPPEQEKSPKKIEEKTVEEDAIDTSGDAQESPDAEQSENKKS